MQSWTYVRDTYYIAFYSYSLFKKLAAAPMVCPADDEHEEPKRRVSLLRSITRAKARRRNRVSHPVHDFHLGNNVLMAWHRSTNTARVQTCIIPRSGILVPGSQKTKTNQTIAKPAYGCYDRIPSAITCPTAVEAVTLYRLLWVGKQ